MEKLTNNQILLIKLGIQALQDNLENTYNNENISQDYKQILENQYKEISKLYEILKDQKIIIQIIK
jgi:uncharacterized protein (UPF0276 family)